MKLLRSRGEVALFHPSDADRFARARAILRPLYRNVPIICDLRKPGTPLWTLRSVRAMLGSRHDGGITVVTEDPDLAADAAAWKNGAFEVRFIGRDARRFAGLRKLKRFDSISRWQESLAVEGE